VWLVILKPMSAAVPPVSAKTAADRAAQVRLRRALTLMLMTVVLPGSAQLAAGNKRVGHNALRALAAAVLFMMALVLTLLVSRDEIIQLFTNVWFLGLLRFGLILYAVGWAYLLIDAWRIADPLGLRQNQRLAMTALNGLLCLSLTGVLLYGSHLVAVQKDFIQTVFTQTHVSQAEDGRYNVLLLGGDAGAERVGLRPDSMTVASIDQETGRTVLFSLPRNLAHVPFPPGSVMHKHFPHGFDCPDECLLNAVNTWADDHASLFPGVKDPGVYATSQAIEQITGLTINYDVLVDLSGFQKLVDALGGIVVNVHQEVPIGGVGGAITGYIKPGKQRLNGYQTLWYSRSRAWSSDYSRMARQKCVLNAMLHQLNPETVLTKFGAIASAGKEILSTSLPAGEIHTFVSLALKARNLPVTTVSFVPPKINTGDPDFALIRQMVRAAITKSEAAGTSRAKGHPTKTPASAGTKDSYQQSYAANDTSDLSGSC
jgi:polyisoprenyl-teichoic acid--peptidoglycan teichoic acid transferase